MTFAELIQESNMYEYSKEYYDLVKECAEITVMSQFVKSQTYMFENKNIIESVRKTSGTDFFTESVSSDNIEAIETAITEKAGNVIKTLFDRLGKLLSGLGTMLGNIFNKISGQSISASNIVDYINNKSLASDIVEFGEKALSAANKYKIKCDESKYPIKLFNDRVIDELDKYKLLCLTNALTPECMVISGDYIDIEELMEAINKLLNAKNMPDLESINAYMNSIRNNKILYVPIKEKNCNKLIKLLNKSKDAINKINISNTEKFHSFDINTQFYTEFNSISTDIFKFITNDISGLRDACMFRIDSLKLFNAIIKGNRKFDRNQKNNSDNAEEDDEPVNIYHSDDSSTKIEN